jgi:hypothetical protein
MGLMEFIGETIRPGKIGTVDMKKGKKEKRIGILIIKTILSIAIVTFIYYMTIGLSFHLKESLLFIAILTAYCIVGYFISPKPDYSNVGWFGGVFDNPFKISDDANRILFLSMLILMPGSLISSTIVSWITLFKK